MIDYVVNHYAAIRMNLKNTPYEKAGGVSMTVPGQTLSLRTLIDRYTRGIDVDMFTPQYDEDDIIPDGLEYMTEIERKDMARELSEVVSDLRSGSRSRKVETDAKPAPGAAPGADSGVLPSDSVDQSTGNS